MKTLVEHDRREEPDPRVLFAAERTFLAWIRTGLGLMGLGFIVARFGLFLREIAELDRTPASGLSQWVGVILLVLGVLTTAGATFLHVTTIRRLHRGQPVMAHTSLLAVFLAAMLVVIGAVLASYLFGQI